MVPVLLTWKMNGQLIEGVTTACNVDKIPIYSPKQVSAGSFFGGPIALVYFLHNNFNTLGNSAAAARTLWWGILFNVTILATVPFLPRHFPQYLIPLAYSLTAEYIANAKQLKKEAIATSAHFCFHSNWRVFGLSTALFVATLLVWLPLLYLFYQFHAHGPD
jgi:hypothetical protein